MSITDQVRENLPYLRRYARALCGSQSSGDAYVREMLEATLADESLLRQIGESRVALYSAFNRIWSAGHVEALQTGTPVALHERAASDRLSHLTPVSRQALLLTTLEDFSREEAAEILDLKVEDIDRLVAEGIGDIAVETSTDVLIIEDEPLISMQLEKLATDLGHRVVATAATHSGALKAFGKNPAGLVLADIQLADGSSGIDTVNDLLALEDVPVIFITAYPERLLTGERPEPTYLVTKPFQEATVRAAISQALFFGSSQPPG